MPVRQKDIDRILSRLTVALAESSKKADGLISISLRSDLFDQRHLPRLSGKWFYWAQPNKSTHFLGIGEALRLSCSGDNRLENLVAQYNHWRQKWHHMDLSGAGAKLISFTGFAFDAHDPMEEAWQAWPNAAIFFPEVMIQSQGQNTLLCFTSLTERSDQALLRWSHQLTQLASAINAPLVLSTQTTTLARTATRPTDQEWFTQINQATAQIKSGKLRKVVPFRRISVEADHLLDPARLMAHLDLDYTSSYHFSAHLNGHTFAAVTPERLISRNGLQIRCDAIGGTTRRGSETVSDQNLGDDLLEDSKCRNEHSLVVENIKQVLAPLCTTLENPESPSLIRLPNLQHLWTGFKGALKTDTHLLSLGQALHPTAAVNGSPKADAVQWLSENAPSRRGWYSGAAGWLDSEGNGELAVLLRCALLQGNSADLFAGAGITDASEPNSELQETELKFSTMLQALQHAAY